MKEGSSPAAIAPPVEAHADAAPEAVKVLLSAAASIADQLKLSVTFNDRRSTQTKCGLYRSFCSEGPKGRNL